jgi:DNA-directed RNA polymerase subunit E'/Rpb7
LSENAVRVSTIRELKILAEYAELHLMNKKNWEFRKKDRNFKAGDKVNFKIIGCENRKSLYFGEYERNIDFVFEGGEYGLEKRYCILSIS